MLNLRSVSAHLNLLPEECPWGALRKGFKSLFTQIYFLVQAVKKRARFCPKESCRIGSPAEAPIVVDSFDSERAVEINESGERAI